MSNQSNTRKATVELRPSRIRREPVRADAPAGPSWMARWDPTERETWIVVAGVIMFATAIFIVTIGISDITSR